MNALPFKRARDGQVHMLATLLLSMLTLVSSIASAGLFGPSNFEECVLDGMKGISSDKAANAVLMACRSKFPESEKKQAPIEVNPVRREARFSVLSAERPGLNSLVAKIELRRMRVVQTGRIDYGVQSYDYGHHLAIEVTNRNDFPIGALQIAIPRKKGQSCTWNEADYVEMYFCDGQTPSLGSATYRCEVPQIESRKSTPICVTGFGFYGNDAEIDAFMTRNSIPKLKR